MARFIQRDTSTNTIQFDTGVGDRMAIILGTFTIDYSVNPNGSITVPALSGARGFAFRRGTGYEGTPNVTISGSTLSWQRTTNASGNFPDTGSWDVLYGGINLTNLGPLTSSRLNLRDTASGVYLFSSLYASYRHGPRASVSSSGINYQRAIGWKIVPNSGSYDLSTMIALRPLNYLAAPMGNFFSDGAYRGLTIAAANGWNGAGDYFVIDRPAVPAARPGLNTYNTATGELTFSSRYQTMRAIDVLDGVPQSWTGIPGRQYAAIFSGNIGYGGDEETDVTLQGGQLIIGDDPPYYVYRGYALGVMVNSTTPHRLDFDYVQHSGNNYGVKKASPMAPRYFTGSIMIIDVTGL